MRRRHFALPMLIAMVLGVLAGPSTTATAADETGSISGTVTYPEGDVTRIAVSITSAEQGHSAGYARVGADGRWAASVPAGTYRVRFHSAVGDPSVVAQTWSDAGSDIVTVEAGNALQGIDASIRRGGSVVVRHRKPEPTSALQVTLFHRRDGAWVAASDPEYLGVGMPTMTFSGLVPDEYRVQVEPIPPSDSVHRGDHVTLPTARFLSDGVDAVVTAGSRGIVDVGTLAEKLVQPTTRPSVHERPEDNVFDLTPATYPSGATVLSRQWFAGDWLLEPIPSATGRTLEAAQEVLGQHVRVRTIVRQPGFADTAHWTYPLPSHRLLPRNVQATLGQARVDTEVTAGRSGDWLGGSWYVYSWYIDGTHITSDSSGRFSPPRWAAGKTLRVRVSNDLEGYRTVAEASTRIALGRRTLVKRPRVDQARAGSYANFNDLHDLWSPAPASYDGDWRQTYQWLLDGRPTGRPNRMGLRLASDLAGHKIQMRVTLTQPGYETAVATTAPFTIERARFVRTEWPDIESFRPEVGTTVRAVTGDWAPRPKRFSYQWYLSGKKIKGATKPRLTVTKRMEGEQLRVRITAFRPGYEPTTTTSLRYRVYGSGVR